MVVEFVKRLFNGNSYHPDPESSIRLEIADEWYTIDKNGVWYKEVPRVFRTSYIPIKDPILTSWINDVYVARNGKRNQ